jgi:ferritin-like metal-binding protein YciE
MVTPKATSSGLSRFSLSSTKSLKKKPVMRSPALDAGLLAAAQSVEHYEISRYGTLRTWAEELGHTDAASLLQETLDEEKATDEALTRIAESVVNQQAEAA